MLLNLFSLLGLNAGALAKYMNLDTTGISKIVQVLYVWIDGSGQQLRCKTKSLDFEPKDPKDCPIWNFDGSSTNQALGHNSDVYLHPVALFPDPFRRLPNKICLCETYTFDHKPTNSNYRKTCNEVHETEAVKV